MSTNDRQKSIQNFVSKIKSQKAAQPSVDDLIQKIKWGDKSALSQAITLVESTKSSDIPMAHKIVEACLNASKKTQRIAISGPPGVGKSTFINAITSYWIEKKHRVAILSIDPTSSISQGSILGDKTRMEAISGQDAVFIRPSAAGTTLGGVHQKTQEAILLCEAAGYDIILVETVGVGQSEYSVQQMTDLFILLLMPRGGDALQGIKKGIMEAADIVLINKADQFEKNHIQNTVSDYKQALHLLALKESGWTVPVLPSSAFDETLLKPILTSIERFYEHAYLKGHIGALRNNQWQTWFKESVPWAIQEVLKSQGIQVEDLVVNSSELPPAKALEIVLQLFKSNNPS